MSSEKLTGNLLTPTRRGLLVGAATLSATAMLPQLALAEAPPTAQVNTTGLAVTDSEVTVGILHSVTARWQSARPDRWKPRSSRSSRSMRKAACSAARSNSSRKTAPATGRLSPRRRRSSWCRTNAPPSWVAGPRPRARRCCRCSSNTTACSTTRPSMKVSSSRRMSSTPGRKLPSKFLPD